jgi:hypothetical protein
MVTSKTALEASGSGNIVSQTGFAAVLINFAAAAVPRVCACQLQCGTAYENPLRKACSRTVAHP